ncbi:MAG TPA: GTP-binding protein [Chloroflexi bacterium]|nr:MAG: dynamin [Chloroflexota bacterium]HDD55904.1 GTP-binding protein [Chloroflexota bacterium]
MELLTQTQKDLLSLERKLLNEIQITLVEYGVQDKDQRALEESIRQLDDFFLLVVVGEFNAGKSAFINALLGEAALEEGVTPTTTKVNILRFGEPRESIVLTENIESLTINSPLLKEISIVDTPGTNAIIREHEEITSLFIPRADLILFVTSADRPYTESEKTFLEQIQSWGKKVVLVINKIDILQTPQALEEVEEFVSENIKKLLKVDPVIFPVSAKLALQAKSGHPAVWEKSRFESLERYIQETLDEQSRLKLKLLNPLGVGKRLALQYSEFYDSRLKLLRDDLALIQDIEDQLKIFQRDMLESFEMRLSDIIKILLEMEQRGEDFFSEYIRLARIPDLIKKDKIQGIYEKEVVADVPNQVERKVTAIIDWLVDANLRQWQAITDHIAAGRQKYKGRMVGNIGSFNYDRERLISSIRDEANRVIESYDRVREADQIARRSQNAVAATAAISAGAVGLGTLVAVLASTLATDVTGILLAGVMAALGLFIIPTRRRNAKKEMRQKVRVMREQLTRSLGNHFREEIDRGLQMIRDTIDPYTRFVRAENEKNLQAHETLQGYLSEIIQIEDRIGNLQE